MNIQGWFPLGWTDWISLQSKGLPRVFSNTTVQKHQFVSSQPSLWFNSHIHTWILSFRVKIIHWIRFSFSTFVIIIWLFIICVSFYWKVKVNWKLTLKSYDQHSILKIRDITLPTKVRLVKALVFPVVMYGCESWTVKKAECRRIDAFELWFWRRLLGVPWTARRSNQSILGKSVLNTHWKHWC